MYNVLIVDNEELMRKALQILISKEKDFKVAGCVDTGEEALDICSHENIHIVIMDVLLPGISGIEASKAIYNINPSIVIYIMSAFNSFEFIKDALNVGVYNYISKPISHKELSDLLHSYLQKQKEEQDFSAVLISVVFKRKYGEISSTVSEIVDQIFSRNGGDQNSVQNQFVQIAENIFSTIAENSLNNMNFREEFYINQTFSGKTVYWNFWLNNIMDHAFRMSFLQKYRNIQNVFDYIDSEIKNNISLGEICEKCKISQSYLSKLFRQYFNVSVMDYIHLRKLLQAKIYIAFTDFSMTEIGYHMGYNDGSYFSKVFKKYEKISPKQYKLSLMGVI